MISKAAVKLIRSLHQKKFRQEHRLFLVEGHKILDDYLQVKQPIHRIHSIYCTEEYFDSNRSLIQSSGHTANVITEEELSKITALNTPQEILTVMEMPSHSDEPGNAKDILSEATRKKNLVLVLDDIRDPGNLGTIIRTADWFGIEHIICSPETADVFNPKVVQGSMGSLFRMSVFYHDLTSLLKENKKHFNYPVYGTFLNGENLYSRELHTKGLIVIGNEARGINPELETYIMLKIRIPGYSLGAGPNSLNAAIATAIVCAEFRRQGSIEE